MMARQGAGGAVTLPPPIHQIRAAMPPSPARIWRTPAGGTVACAEKLKVLEQNLEEFETVARDILEDAALMGCDVEQVRAVLRERLDLLRVRYSGRGI
ncbi:hypothetical protein [Magnetospirillum sp. UT-4]|uniref:hypothetical protein n=1 Tax=Magnetospirillum sp. UT-4 TaxID=2681467 RepID=UPI001383E948|nr:hypothetical protein [Magnetospirillum sp. UT-4]CAA7619682.1 hypothetical protein MTBUT4_310041 [Magnetospirillum sp. UT-4]